MAMKNNQITKMLLVVLLAMVIMFISPACAGGGDAEFRQRMDVALRAYAIKRLMQEGHAVVTGVAYEVHLPESFLVSIFNGSIPSGAAVHCQALRVRAGGLRRRGLSINEFNIPKGAVYLHDGPSVFMLMVYSRISGSSPALYGLPSGDELLTSVAGIAAYWSSSATIDFNSTAESQLTLPATSAPITFSPEIPPAELAKATPPMPRCATFFLNGTVAFTDLNSAAQCTLFSLANTAVIRPAPPPTPTPAPAPSPFHPANILTPTISIPKNSTKLRTLVYATIPAAAILFVAVVIMTVLLCRRLLTDKCGVAAGSGGIGECSLETLHTSMIGHTRAPTAAGIRTKPALEVGSLQLL